MTKYKTLLIFPFLVLMLAAVSLIRPSRGQEQKPRLGHQPRVFDESRFPIADYTAAEPADPQVRVKRQVKGKKYDKSEWRVYPKAISDSMVRIDYVDRKLPALPFEQSSAVIVGQVTEANAYLSNDKSGVYSVFTVQVNEVLKNSSKTPISNSSAIEVERDGGRVRFPNGRIHMYRIAELDMPKVGLRYVLFLNNDDEILTGYELRNGKVYPLDDLPNLQTYEQTDELSFLSELRTKSL